eukprot:12425162-Karenia_brevis.AAC.1
MAPRNLIYLGRLPQEPKAAHCLRQLKILSCAVNITWARASAAGPVAHISPHTIQHSSGCELVAA